ncbi:MAG TPA: multidrug efflux SMR transporter [Gammaproteobacteria bacterium]|mgnify:CR=1 FL=1|nr:multidrug efflux SMR transporter [Gammaproteobacteria bacterium]
MDYEWIFVALAVVAEIVAALALRFSHGFSKPLPTVLALTAFGLAFYMVSLALVSLPVSTVYPIWAGGGTAGVAVLGIVTLNERAGVWKSLGVVMVVAGIVLLNMMPTDHGA